jgi:hypothetical protein
MHLSSNLLESFYKNQMQQELKLVTSLLTLGIIPWDIFFSLSLVFMIVPNLRSIAMLSVPLMAPEAERR